MKWFRFEHKITLAYLIIGCLWIAFSDKLLLMMFDDPATLSQAQTYKGWFYVIATAFLFYIVLHRYILKIRRSEAKAQESEHLKTAFLENISHEIRTPMNSICGFSELLKKEKLPAEKKRHFIDIIQKNSSQLLSIINDVISISRIETNQETVSIEKVNAFTLVKGVFDIHLPTAKSKGISFALNVKSSDRDLIINTDGDKLRQVLWNLVDNAIKFTQKGSVVLSLETSNNSIRISIEDTGIGIAPKYHEKVFERFIQANSDIRLRYGGTGLGLTIAKSYVELLGGTINISSKLNEGTTVLIHLPISISITKEVKDIIPESAQDIKPKNGHTILIAEDEEFNYLYLQELLSESYPNLIRARNGQEAVAICANNPEIDFVIMDTRMPVMNGSEATKLIKKLRPNLPIIAHTAYASPNDEIETKKNGADEYLPKPLNEKKLFELLEKYKTIM